MIPHKTKAGKLPGTSYKETRDHAIALFNQIKRKTKRKPYIRSVYFGRKKVFFDNFWDHLYQKSPKERFRRLKYFAAAVEVIKNSRNRPSAKPNPNRKTETLYRFAGLTKNNELFYVQIKEKKRSKARYFMSCFPPD